MPHVPPLLRLTAYFYQLTIETRGLFHSPPPLMKCSNQVMAHRARRGKLPLATFVSQPGYTIYHSPNSYLGMVLANRLLANVPVQVERRPIYIPRERGVKVADLVGSNEPPRKSSY